MFDAFNAAAAKPAPDWIAQSARSAGFVRDRRFGPADRRQTPANEAASHDEALDEAFARGEAAGRAAEREAFASERARESRLRSSLARIDAEAARALTARLTETVALLCERTLEPLALDREHLAHRCARAVSLMAEETARLTLFVHPGDLPALAEDLAETVRIEPDAALDRGGLRLEGVEGSLLDGPEQWRAAIAQALGTDGE